MEIPFSQATTTERRREMNRAALILLLTLTACQPVIEPQWYAEESAGETQKMEDD
jgi:hypothetical protein